MTWTTAATAENGKNRSMAIFMDMQIRGEL